MDNELDSIEARNALTGLAELLAHYVAELKAQGFSHKEAITLALGYQHATAGGMWKGDS